jgi:DNA polymerase III epsilon subunit family exonuclease
MSKRGKILLTIIGIIVLTALTHGVFLIFLFLFGLFYLKRFLKREEEKLKYLCEDYYRGGTFIALDLETTGLNFQKDEIIEIGTIKFNKEGKIESFVKLIRPSQYVPFEIQEMTGLSISKIMEDGKEIEEIKENFINFLNNYPIVGWNLDFDLEFLNKRGIKISNPKIDLLEIAYNLLPKRKRKGRRYVRRRFYLTSIAKDFGIYTRTDHRAGSDAYLTMKVFEKIMEQLKYKFGI